MSLFINASKLKFYSVTACSPWTATPIHQGVKLTATIKKDYGEETEIELEVNADASDSVVRGLDKNMAAEEKPKEKGGSMAFLFALGVVLGATIVLLAVKP